jgi:hypothetical protein
MRSQQENSLYTFQVTLETEQLLEQVVVITTDEEHPSTATLERLARATFDDHAWQHRDISPNSRVVGVKRIEDKKSVLSTDKCYYQLEFHLYDHTESYVLLPGENWRRFVEEYRHQMVDHIVADILHQYPGATRVYSAQMEAEQKKRQEEYEEKQASCAHENAWITLYEKYQTTYKLKGGEISETDEDLEPDPLWGVEFTCPDCHLCGYYPDWTNAPEPLRTYCQHGANEREGNGQKHV